MLVLISGEGLTDVGVYDAGRFLVGPMAFFVDQWLERRIGYSLLEFKMFKFIPKSELKQRCKSLKPFSRRGKKTAAETRFFFNNARAMAQIAIECKQSENVDILAILFRDSDDAASCGRGLWHEKHQSMLDGFTREKFLYGVPMVPRPISEAWLLCALRERYQHCDRLENESGRCGTANPLKKQLEAFLGKPATRDLLVGKIKHGDLSIHNITMPSMMAFKNRCDEVLNLLRIGQSEECG